jgi:type I restriction enzyme S subunit
VNDLTQLSDYCSSITDGDHQAPPRADQGIPFITISAMNDGRIDLSKATRFVPLDYWESLKETRKPRTGDVLYSVTGSFGIPALVREDRPFVFQRHIALLRPDPDRCDATWLTYILAAAQTFDQARAIATGTAQLTVPLAGLRSMKVPHINLSKQRRIAAKLDILTGGLARARASVEGIQSLVSQWRQAVLSSAFEGKFGSGEKITNLPCDRYIHSTFYGPRFGKNEYVTDGVRTVRTTDFNRDGTMSLGGIPQVACSGSDFAKWGLRDGDLLVTRTGSIGKCALYKVAYGPMLPSAYLIRVRFTPDVLSRFAWMMFASPQGQAHLGVNSRAVTQPNINASAIRSLPFPSLTIEEQQVTVDAVDQCFARADRLEAEATRARALLDRLEAAILAKAFRGDLVSQEPNDEPASVRLDRIRATRTETPRPKRVLRNSPS